MKDRRSWKPVLKGKQREVALEKIAAIADELAAMEVGLGLEADPSLGSGLAGIALFFSYLPAELADSQGAVRGGKLINRAAQSPALVRWGPSLLGGATGVAWAVEHLTRPALEQIGADPLFSFDQALLHSVERWSAGQSYDLISGLAGIGIYALDRYASSVARSCVAEAVDRLHHLAVPVPNGIAWPTPHDPSLPADADRQLYDLGVAHGIAGVIGFLAMAHAAGIRRRKSRELLRGAVSCLMAQENVDANGPRFPYTVSFSGREDRRPPRIAWCYGDAGIAAALHLAGCSLGMAQWIRKALQLARHASTLSPESAGVTDSGLCHGSAGLAHIFNRLGQTTGDGELLRAARRWYETTLQMERPNGGNMGFSARGVYQEQPLKWVADPGLLGGAAGVGLALSAAVSQEPAWDSILLTSMPPWCRRPR